MHKELILEAFKKAEKERKNKGDNKPSTIHIAEDLSEFVYSVENFSLGERSFRIYRNDAIALIEESNKDINIKQLKIVNGLCKYLGYEDFTDFKTEKRKLLDNMKPIMTETKDDKNIISIKNKIINFLKINKITIITSSIIIIIIIVFTITHISQQRWIIWDNDHYKEVQFDTKKYDFAKLKLFSADKITHFKQITPDCETVFFKENGSPNLWYGKSNKGELEYFTSLGKHPITGKTLKKITTYMINKHICKTYK